MRRMLLLLFVVLAFCSQAFAQEPTQPLPSPSPEPESKVAVAAFAGGAAVWTRGENDEFVQFRGQINVYLSKRFTVFGRGELLATQDGGSLDTLPDPNLFHSVDLLLGGRYSVTDRFSVGALGGVTVSAEGEEGAPADPRLWTALVVARVGLGKLGYAYAGSGWYGQVGGYAAVMALQIPVVDDDHAYTFFDFALPLEYNVFNEKTWVMRTGVTVKIGEWGL